MSLTQLDQGNYTQFVRTWLGSTIGWVDLPVTPETFVTTGPSYTVQPFDSKVLLNSISTPVTDVALPSVATWIKSLYQQVQSPFDRSLWIKDYAYKATANNITITPHGSETIDGLPSFQVINDGQLIRLYPLTDLSGWFVG